MTRIAVPVAIVALAAASLVAIPVGPVPITLQTLAVTVIAGVCGWRVAVVAILLWLVAGACGLPVLAGGASGLARFTGATAGYLFAFPLAGLAVGLLADRGWTRTLPRAAMTLLLGHAICLVGGFAWLAAHVGGGPAWTTGVVPFLPGAVLKTVAGALIATWLRRAVGPSIDRSRDPARKPAENRQSDEPSS